MSRTKFTNKALQDLLAAKLSGKTCKELATIHNVGVVRISYLLRKAKGLQKLTKNQSDHVKQIKNAISILNTITFKPPMQLSEREYKWLRTADRAKWELERTLSDFREDQ